jgi:hypothetical protein
MMTTLSEWSKITICREAKYRAASISSLFHQTRGVNGDGILYTVLLSGHERSRHQPTDEVIVNFIPASNQ